MKALNHLVGQSIATGFELQQLFPDASHALNVANPGDSDLAANFWAIPFG